MKHVSKDGIVRECRAEKGRCPLEHFESVGEAERELEARYSQPLQKNKHEVTLEPNVEKAIAALSQAGKPYVVGGAVRDSFFGAENKDVDIEVHSTDLDSITRELRKSGYSVDEVGRSFGVLKISGNGVRDLDVSVPRRENRVGAGHRDFEVDLSPMSVREAAERRDFTFNAIMYDSENKKLVDPTGGAKDLNNGVMRHVSAKFKEDPLRTLRGFQFAGRFSMKYDPETAEMCKGLRGEYGSLPAERVSEEWRKFYTKSTDAKAGVKALQDSGWDDTEPGLRKALARDNTQQSLQRLKNLPSDERHVQGIAATTRSMNDEEASSFRSRMSSSKAEAHQAAALRKAESADLSTAEKRRWFAYENSAFSFKRASLYSGVVQDNKLQKASESAANEGLADGPEKDLFNGTEVSEAAGKAPGPWMKPALDELRGLQYSRKVTTREGLLAEASRRFK